MADARDNPLLRAVWVHNGPDGDCFFEAGKYDITAVEWHEQPGHMAMIPTIRVFKHGKLYSEHPFSSVLGVYYKAYYRDAAS